APSAPVALLSFHTRRSSDLHAFLDDELDLTHSLDVQHHLDTCPACAREHAAQRALRGALRDEALYFRPPEGFTTRARAALRATRSEEHTSELQSRVDLVCRL